jgi:hypothetical protein
MNISLNVSRGIEIAELVDFVISQGKSVPVDFPVNIEVENHI